MLRERNVLSGVWTTPNHRPIFLVGCETPSWPILSEQIMYSQKTRSIEVTVKPMYLDDQSSPSDDHYVWAYWVRIDNQGSETVQLRSRYWHITDATGRIQEVRGAGVVGEQPVLQPGQSYEYTSGTPLPTPSGIMLGSYEMESEQGERFEIDIPPFSLDSPYQEKSIN